MITKETLNRLILNETNALDLQALKKMVKEYIDKYYGEKLNVNGRVKNEYGYTYHGIPAKTTLTTVFNLFKERFMNDNKSIKKQFKYLNSNYNSKYKLRDLMIFKLKIDGYSFVQIAEITNLSKVRIKQIYYIVKKMINDLSIS